MKALIVLIVLAVQLSTAIPKLAPPTPLMVHALLLGVRLYLPCPRIFSYSYTKLSILSILSCFAPNPVCPQDS